MFKIRVYKLKYDFLFESELSFIKSLKKSFNFFICASQSYFSNKEYDYSSLN
jgi:hypothetical protein